MRLFMAMVIAAAITAGCSSTPSAPVEFDAEMVRQEASAAMAAIDSVHFQVERSGAEVFIDDAGLVVFEQADGRFATPASADAVVSVLLLGTTIELGAVAIDGQLYLTDPLSGVWQDATGTIAFDPAKIFSADAGIAEVLASGMPTATLQSKSPDADGLLRLEGVVDAADVDTLTSGLVSEEASATVSIDAETFLVRSITFDTPIDDSVATWSVELSDYGATVDIVAPDLDGA